MNEWAFKGRKIRLVGANIALLEVQAVVNTANRNLVPGSRVAGAKGFIALS